MRPFRAMRSGSGGGSAGSTAYYDAVLADTPWGYWRLDESSGTVAGDSSGGGHSISSQLNFSSISSAGLLVNNTNKGVLLPSTASGGMSGFNSLTGSGRPSTASPFTAECFIKPTAAPPEAGVGAIWTLGTSTNAPAFEVTDIGGGSFRIRVMKKGVAVLFTSAGSWAYGTKLHVALRFGASSLIQLVVNGVADANSATFAYADSSSEYMTIGYGYYTSDQYHLTGNMDELALYGSALTDARLLAHYNASL